MGEVTKPLKPAEVQSALDGNTKAYEAARSSTFANWYSINNTGDKVAFDLPAKVYKAKSMAIMEMTNNSTLLPDNFDKLLEQYWA